MAEYAPRITAALAACQMRRQYMRETDPDDMDLSAEARRGRELAEAVEAELPQALALLALAERMVAAQHVLQDPWVLEKSIDGLAARDDMDAAVAAWDALHEAGRIGDGQQHV